MVSTLIALIVALIAYHPAQGTEITAQTAVCRQVEVSDHEYIVAVTTPPLDEDEYGDLSTFDAFDGYNVIGFVSQDPDVSCKTVFSFRW